MQPTNQTKPTNKRSGRKSRRRTATKPKNVNAAPTAISLVAKTRVPAIKATPRGFVVTHREFIQDVTAADANFRNTTFSVNPGLATTFPWLSAIAGRFESYLFRRLHFIYEPICPTTTPGAVMMAVDYDAVDAAPTSKVVLMAYRGAVRSAPWNITRFDATRGDLRKFGVQRFVRTGSTPANADLKTYDVGNLQLATQNTPATATTLGELYVEYEVEFFTPQIPTTVVRSQRNVTQTAKIDIPAAGAGNIVLASKITGDTNTPPFWLHGPSDRGVNLILDANRVQTFFLNLRSPDLSKITGGPLRVAQLYENMKLFDAKDFDVGRVGGQPDSIDQWGIPFNDTITNFDYTLYFRVPAATQSRTIGANLIPMFLPRPSSGTTTLYITLRPAPSSPGAVYNSSLLTTGTDWAFPQLDIPSLTSTSASTSKRYDDSSPGLVQQIMYIPDDEITIQPHKKK
uniref:Capsid protein n=1 Tax=Wenzhou noda-like virus 1 TaxID=1923585 RepID=A0A1L3KGP7_9VIRU|nr:hypothetical protein 2 [Wenzhou noda-like virus 1]